MRLEAELTEKEWDHQLFATQGGLATMLGWKLRYHTLRSKGSQPGFPDRVLVRDRVIFVELKTDAGRPTERQRDWLDGLAAAGAEVYLWRPRDLDEIGKILSGRWTWNSFLSLLSNRYMSDLDRQIADDPLHPSRDSYITWQPKSLWVAGNGGRVDE